MQKTCGHCGVAKVIDDFYRDTAARDGHRPECKACTAARRAAWYEQNRSREIQRVQAWRDGNRDRTNRTQRLRRERPDVKRRERDAHLQRKYGITIEAYEAMLAAQGGVCAICGSAPPDGSSLHVDHDHETGAVRGILCFRCNNAIGDLRHDAALLEAAAAYLRATDPDDVDELIRERVRALVRA